MRADPDRWLRSLPDDLSRQRAVIVALLDRARTDRRVRVFAVGCSIGRGAADALSDVDALIGVREEAAAELMADSGTIVRGAGRVLDLFQQQMPATTPDGRPWQHTFALYADGVELDLAVAVAREPWRPHADWVVLHDPDAAVSGDVVRVTTTPDDVRRWTYNGAVRLNACAKHLARGALWEARLCLERARADYWCLRATADRVADPQYGLTAILDDPRRPIPPRADTTVAGLDGAAIGRAAGALLELLADAWAPATAAVGADGAPVPTLLAYVRDRLRSAAT